MEGPEKGPVPEGFFPPCVAKLRPGGYPRELFAPLRRSIALEEELTNGWTNERMNERTNGTDVQSRKVK